MTSFEILKECLVKPPVLRVPDPRRTFIVLTDASDVEIEAALNKQDDNGNEHSIACTLRKTSYLAVEKECLTIIWPWKYFSSTICMLKPSSSIQTIKHLT